METKREQLKKLVEESQKIVFFGGAGVSTESGIPDFRSADGLFMKESGFHYSPQEIVSYSFFKQHPAIFFEYYFTHLVHTEAKPNVTHQCLAKWEKQGKQVEVITQNIDGLHQKAGSLNVHELHGSIWRNTCITCGTTYALQELVKDGEGVPRCSKDGGIIKPDVTLYQEPLDELVIQQAYHAMQEADLLIVAGTSLAVYPAAGMIDWFNGNNVVVINKTPIEVSIKDALVFEEELTKVFSVFEK